MTLATVQGYDPDRLSPSGGHAVVVGASVAGLLAARVLGDGFESVTVIERDPIPADPTARRGVPQGHHLHVMLEAGRDTIEQLVPGYGEALLRAGGLLIDAMGDLQFFDRGDYYAPASCRIDMYCASRPLFEHVLRRRVSDRDGIEVRGGHQFTDYLFDRSAARVEGVTVRRQGASDRELPADLVVDATGRASLTPTWLEAQGFPRPPLEEVHVDVEYSSVPIERPPGDRRMISIPPDAPVPRGGAAVPIEDGRWLCTLMGMHGAAPPRSVDEFEDYAATLPAPELEQLLAAHEPVRAQPETYPFPSDRRYRYEDLDRFPEGVVVLGDAIASFNPIYGQGMSVAALEALELHHALAAADTGTDLPMAYFDRVADVVDTAWLLALGADFEFAATAGPKPRGTALFNRYFDRLVRRAHDDGVLTEAVYRVLSMDRPPTSLLRPGVLRRVLLPI